MLRSAQWHQRRVVGLAALLTVVRASGEIEGDMEGTGVTVRGATGRNLAVGTIGEGGGGVTGGGG